MVRHNKQSDFGELALVSLKYMSFVICVNVINQEIIDFWFRCFFLKIFKFNLIIYLFYLLHMYMQTQS